MSVQHITILGSTGSIGVSTLDVLARHPEEFQVFALSGHNRIDVLAEQCQRFLPKFAVVTHPEAARQLNTLVPTQTRVLCGVEGLREIAGHEKVDTVVAAIVGAAGLQPVMVAARAGKKILLANKEALVMAGGLFMETLSRSGASLLPLDSEHNAIFQCLPPGFEGIPGSGVSKLILSASGGPFRKTALSELSDVTPEQACAHPNWNMGRKISVDSATMMNKGLELIEACWLFAVDVEEVDILIHPQSIVHSLVEYVDGSVLAQLGNPDMRTPIAHALAWPRRIASGVARLNLAELARLEFETPDEARFPALALARQAGRSMGDVPAALNAANEVAVAAFLSKQIRFPRIVDVVAEVLAHWQSSEPASLEEVQEADARARLLADESVSRFQNEV